MSQLFNSDRTALTVFRMAQIAARPTPRTPTTPTKPKATIDSRAIRNRWPELNLAGLTDDELYVLVAFYRSSHRFRDGKSERTGVVRFFLTNHMGWRHDRVSFAMKGLESKGVVSKVSKGIRLNVEVPSNKPKALAVDARCAYCRRKLTQSNASWDHVIPQSRGGGGGDNVVRSCVPCNQLKADRTRTEWAKAILDYRKPVVDHRLPRWHSRLILRLRVWLTLALGVAQ